MMNVSASRHAALSILAASCVAASCEKREVAVSRTANVDETYELTSSWATFAQAVDDKGPAAQMDVLFVIDNSSSMASSQAKLRASFPGMMKVFEALPGGMPGLHIGIVSTDLGAGAFNVPEVPCVFGGDQGKLQFAPRDPVACARGSLLPNQTFLSNIDGVANYTGSLSDAFSCIAALGQSGCGFEQPLASAMRALGIDGNGFAPPENSRFLRADAYLAIIVLTNEDDCSTPIDSRFFDPTSMKIGDSLGPLTSFRCNAFGHRCRSGGGPEAGPSMTTAAMYTECRSNEEGPLVKVADFAAALQRLKGDPARVYFATIAGPPLPYAVTVDQKPTNDDPKDWPAVAHSCEVPSSVQPDVYADPGVRLWGATQTFGSHGTFESICNSNYAPVLAQIADGLSRPLNQPCVPVTGDGSLCAVVDRWIDGGTRHAARVPACAEVGSQAPCWSFGDSTGCATGARAIVVDRTSTTPPQHLFTAIDCTTAHP